MASILFQGTLGFAVLIGLTSTDAFTVEKPSTKALEHLSHILIQPGAGTGVRFDKAEVKPMTPGDLAAIVDSKKCPSLVAAAPVIRARSELTYKSKKWVPIFIYGTTPEFLKVRDRKELAQGKSFGKSDVDNQGRVCLLGKTVVAELFGDEDPIGKELRLQNVPIKVVGVLRAKGANPLGIDQDDIVLIPWTTMKFRVQPVAPDNVNSLSDFDPNPNVGEIYPLPVEKPKKEGEKPKPKLDVNFDFIEARARSLKEIPQAVQEVRKALREHRKLKAEQRDDFGIRDVSELYRLLEKKR
jgi:hypothetical protein